MKKNDRDTVHILVLLAMVLFFMTPEKVYARDAYLKIKTRLHPIYVKDLKINYYRSLAPSQALVIHLKHQGKYQELPLDSIRKIKFLQLEGSRNFHPVFRIWIDFNKNAHGIRARLNPVRSFQGFYGGRTRVFDMRIDDTMKQKFELEYIMFKNSTINGNSL